MFNSAGTLLVLLISTVLLVSADKTPRRIYFAPRIWSSGFDHNLVVDGLSDAASIVYRSKKSFRGFLVSFERDPNKTYGLLYRSLNGTGTVKAKMYSYLKPLLTNGHYELKWDANIPRYPDGILSSNFTTQGFACSGNCGAAVLKYSLDELNPMSSFFLTQNNSRKDVWHLKWTRNGFLYPVPEDAEAVTVVFDKERGVKYQTR